ncbi:MAG TPA: hypothetical protein VGL80_32355 [Pseudonocardiaceae bacterium]
MRILVSILDDEGWDMKFPAEGGTYRADYGADMVVDHDYTAAGKLTYTMTKPSPFYTYTADIACTRIRDDVYTVTFEDMQARMVLIEDFGASKVTTFMAMKDGTFAEYTGTFTRL